MVELQQKNLLELAAIRTRGEWDNWRVGEIAQEEWERNLAQGGKHYQQAIFAEISHQSSYSYAQVEKMYLLACKFSPEIRARYPGYRLGYYEVARQFPGEELDVLDYVGVYVEEKGEWPMATQLAFWYRKDVLGKNDIIAEYTGCDTIPLEPGEPTDQPYSVISDNFLVRFLQTLRGYVSDRPLSINGRAKLVHGIQLIEEVLPEILGIKVQ